MKKILSLALALIMVMSLFNGVTVSAATVTASGKCGDNLTWTLDEDGVLTISGTGEMENYTYYSSIPWKSYTDSIESIIVKYGVTSISDEVFRWCDYLTTVKISDSVTSIGGSAFEECRSLSSVDLGSGISSISEKLFNNCVSLATIEIPISVTSIGEYAFGSCHSLTEVEIPDSVTSIGGSAFYECDSLIAIEIPDSVTSIGGSAFYECDSLIAIEIPDSITSIEEGTFVWCESLNSIKIPNSVTNISDNAFWGCESLTSIEIPNSVTSIGSRIFSYCASLESIVLASGNTKYHSDSNCIIETATNTLVTGCKNSIIPDYVTSIGYRSFDGCTSLTELEIPDSVTSIGGSAFNDCTSLTSIEIPDSVTDIGEYAFNYCTSLAVIEMPVSVTNIGDDAFYDCESLTDVYYGGTEEEWNAIGIGSYNEDLTNANIHFNSSMPGGEADSGTVKAFGDASKGVTIELISGGAVVDTKTVTGNSGTYTFEGVEAGTYAVRVSKSKHAPREYEITVADSNVTQDVEIWLYGDVTGDGIINAGDTLQINRKVANLSSVFNLAEDTDYRFKVANVTNLVMGDVILNAADTLQINRKVANLSSIFDTIA